MLQTSAKTTQNSKIENPILEKENEHFPEKKKHSGLMGTYENAKEAFGGARIEVAEVAERSGIFGKSPLTE